MGFLGEDTYYDKKRRRCAEAAIKTSTEIYVWVLTCPDEGVYLPLTKAAAMRMVDKAIENNALSLDNRISTGVENWTYREISKKKYLYIN